MTHSAPAPWTEAPTTARLILADGTVIEGYGLGATGSAVGEVCFNTAMTGYQKILTDPSYAGQIITFTFPHIGNVGAKGNVLLSVDYSQIELRIVAHMAQDEGMLAAFRADEDIHSTTAGAIYGVSPEAVTKEMRRHAKAINFGLIYGMSAFGLTRSTDLTLSEAETFVKTYFTKFPGVEQYLDGIRKQAASQGYVETLLGRKRHFPALQSKQNVQIKNREEREAINAPIQGTAADIMKIAMLKIPPAIKAAGLK